MGARNSKITVVQAGGADSLPTDAAGLKGLRSESVNSKTRISGRTAWVLHDSEACNKDGDSTEVFLVESDFARDLLEHPAQASGECPATGPGDRKIRVQAQASGASGAHKTIAHTTVPALHINVQQQPAVCAIRPNDKPPLAPAAALTQPRSPVAGTDCTSPVESPKAYKQWRPPTAGHPMHSPKPTGGKTPVASPAAAAAAAAPAVAAVPAAGAAASSAPRQNGVVQAPAAVAAVPAASPVKPAGTADLAAAPPPAGNGSTDAAAPAAAATAQWVIRPSPPIENAYKLGKVLGQGSFGVVRAATHIYSGAEVAVKTIRKSMLRAADVASLRREVEILHHLSGHPSISQLLGVYEELRQLHLVLELYKGGDLFDAIIGKGRHSERTAADVLRTVMTALSYCHAMGVAHRDIKPENFMLTAELPKDFQDKQQQHHGTGASQAPLRPPLLGIGERLKLIDFGLSTFCTDDTPLTDIVGTSYYVAPEVLEGRYGLPADVWSAGVILHIMLTGYAPFDGKDDREILRAVRKGNLDLSKDPIWRSISAEAIAVLSSMLDRDPKKRATADQVMAMPWLGRTAEACGAPSAPLPGEVSERLQHFARMSSFQKEARRVVAGLMRPEEVAGLVAQFRGLDRDHDGRISLSELKEGLARLTLLRGGPLRSHAPQLSEEQLRELLRRSDLNGDGLLDESEFLAAALPSAVLARQATAEAADASGLLPDTRQAPGQSSGNVLSAAFKHFDADGSGYITAEELRQALAEHRHPSGKGPDVEALLSRHDRDADGRISYPEFVDMLVQEVDDANDNYESYDTAVHSARLQDQQRLAPPTSGSAGAATARRPLSVRFSAPGGSGGGGGDGGGRQLRSSESVAAWGVGGVGPSIAASDGGGSRARRDGGGSRAFSQSSTVAAQRPSSRLSALEWSDECAYGEEDAAAATAAAAAQTATRGGGSIITAAAAAATAVSGSAARAPSRLSQPQLQLPDSAVSGSAPRATLRTGSGCHRVTVSGCNALTSDVQGLNRMAEVQNLGGGEFVQYIDGHGVAAKAAAAAAAAAAPLPTQRSSLRAAAPPRLQLPLQPTADVRSRRHSVGGVVLPEDDMLLAAAAASSPPYNVGPRPCAPATSRRTQAARGMHTLDAAHETGLASAFNDPQAASRAAASVPGSPSAMAAAAAAQRVVAGRGSTASPSATPQMRPPLLLPLQQSYAGQYGALPVLQMPLGSPAGDRASERGSCMAGLPPPGGWPLSPGNAAAAATAASAPIRPSRASATGMLPVRNVTPWPASPLTGGGPGASATPAEVLRPAPPSAPLPTLHAAGTGARSRRQSTGSPAWPLVHPASPASPAAAGALPQAASPNNHHHNHHNHHQQQQHLLYQPQLRHNHSISYNGGGGGSCNGSNNTLSPRVAAAPVSGDWAGAAPLAGRRSRRTTQPGVLPPGTEDLILSSRPSSDFDVVAASGFGGGGRAPLMYSGEDDASLSHVLPPGATGLGFGAPYRPLTTSASGRVL